MNDIFSLYFSKLPTLSPIPLYLELENDIFKLMDHFIQHEMEEQASVVVTFDEDWIPQIHVTPELATDMIKQDLSMRELLESHLTLYSYEKPFLIVFRDIQFIFHNQTYIRIAKNIEIHGMTVPMVMIAAMES